MSSTGFKPLFISEEEEDPDRTAMEQREDKENPAGLKQSALMKPYLQEMDELLRSCEELAGVPFGSEVRNCAPPGAYLCTGYIDTHIETQDGTTQGSDDGCEVYQHAELPLSSAGSKLRANMVEYEGQLMKMLAMLESCTEESGVGFEPQADTGQEYVHIRKMPDQEPLKPESPLELKTPPVHSEISESLQRSSPCCEETMIDLSGSGSQVGTEQDPVFNETQTGCTFEESTDTKRREDINELPTDLGSGLDKFKALRPQMDKCIEEVQQMQQRRKELLVEVLQLRDEGGTEEGEEINSRVAELMDVLRREEVRRGEREREMRGLREERAEEEQRLWKVNLERQNLHEELRRLRRRLFAVARDCAQSRAALNHQRRAVELLTGEEEELNSVMLQLTDESSHFRSARQQQLSDLQAKLDSRSFSQASATQEELSECRRQSSWDIQQYLQGERKALEDRYEPVLLALLKRREATAGALVNAKKQAQELRAQLGPLRAEIQELELRRACLNEKLQLITAQRREDVGHNKEAVCYLEECSRELKTELDIQKRKTKEMEELRESLMKQLLLHRAAAEES